MKILLVDDEKAFLSVMSELLRDYGYDVIAAEDGKQARECLETEKVDVIISDVFMPTLDGVRFHSYVREFTDARDVPFIFISGYDDEHTRGLVIDSSIDSFFSKTTPVETIVEHLKTLEHAPQPKSA